MTFDELARLYPEDRDLARRAELETSGKCLACGGTGYVLYCEQGWVRGWAPCECQHGSTNVPLELRNSSVIAWDMHARKLLQAISDLPDIEDAKQ